MNDIVKKIEARVGDIEATLWKGNGHPGVVTRVELCETRDDIQDSKLTEIITSQRRWEKIAFRLALSVVGTLITIAGRMIWEAVNH